MPPTPDPRTTVEALLAERVWYLPGEKVAIATVIQFGAEYGYGNLIHHLKAAWSQHMRDANGFDQESADRAGRFICVWCDTDERTGKKVKRVKA